MVLRILHTSIRIRWAKKYITEDWRIVENDFHFKGFLWNSSSRNLTSCVTPKMTLERDSKHNNWKDSFQEIETKIYTSDRFTCLTNDTSLRRSNSSLNRYYYIVILILLSFFKKKISKCLCVWSLPGPADSQWRGRLHQRQPRQGSGNWEAVYSVSR